MIPALEDALKASSTPEEGLRRAVETIRASNPLYHWTGIYLLRGSRLELAHEIGRPTPHVTIPLDKGICGAAAREKATVIVDDVNADPRYLACNLQTRSEIVVPLLDGRGDVLGEIDIDSDEAAAFTQDDRRALEAAAKAISAFLEKAGAPGRPGPRGREAGAGEHA